MSGTNQRIRGWEQELIVGVVIILLALLKVIFDVTLTRGVLLALAGAGVLALVVLLLARRASPAFGARLEGWRGDRRVWYGGLAVFIAIAVLGLSIRVEGLGSTKEGLESTVADLESTVAGLESTVAGLESTVAGPESTAAGDSAVLEGVRGTGTAVSAEAAALRAARSTLAARELALAALATPTERSPEPTGSPTPTPAPSAADGVGLYWARVGQGEYRSAWNMLSPGFQSDGFTHDFDQYRQGMHDWLEELCDVEVARAKAGNGAGENGAQVDVIMVYQIKPDCATVTHAFEYHLTQAANGDWLIDEVIQLD